jgi:hypothetical protein
MAAAKKKVLDTRNDELDLEGTTRLVNYWSLYAGGRRWDERVKDFLPKRPAEEDDVYSFRVKTSHYVPYAGQIVDYLVSWLFTGKAEFRIKEDEDAKDVAEPPEWFGAFKANADTLGTDLMTFVRDRMRQAMVKQRSWILVDFPSVEDGKDGSERSLAEHRELGLDRGYLVALNAEDVIDWEVDDRGELLWAMVKRRDKRRVNPLRGRDSITDSWTLYTRDEWFKWAITYEVGKEPGDDDDIPLVAQGDVATLGRVPLVHVCVDEGLWAMNRIYSAALEQLRARNALSFSLHRTCHAGRLFFLEGALPGAPITGPGIGMVFGKDERVEWDAPPADAFTPFADYAKDLKDEIYRLVGQMALGVDNNAAAIGRSGDSKAVDAALGEVVMIAYGQVVLGVLKETLDRLSFGRGETEVWHLAGFDKFISPNDLAVVEAATGFDTLAVPSKKARVMMHQKVVRSLLPQASQEELDEIDKEIESGTTDEEMAAVRDKARGVPAIDPNAMLDDPDGEEEGEVAPLPKKAPGGAKKGAKPAPKKKPAKPAKK